MRLSKEQKCVLEAFQSVRLQDIAPSELQSIKAPECSGLVDLFRHETYLADDRCNTLASYVVKNEEGTIMLFFSLRCGELFEEVDPAKMEIGYKALKGLKTLQAAQKSGAEMPADALLAVYKAKSAGMDINNIEYYGWKRDNYLHDQKKESHSGISRVSRVYPGVELKFFGINANAREAWRTLGFPKRMGETLFWHVIVPKLEELRTIAGCKFLYLFAADNDPDGSLVNYYKTVLHINAEPCLSANKPSFDYNSMFLYQDIRLLSEYRKSFFETFNQFEGNDSV